MPDRVRSAGGSPVERGGDGGAVGAVGEVVTIDVHGLAPGGAAVGRQVGGQAPGRVTFVPLAAPGERITARVVKVKRSVAWAELVSIETPAPVRVAPPCGLFGTCGGCQWQHVDRATQLVAKKDIVERALRFTGVRIEAASPDFGYRDRARFVVGPTAVGFRAAGSQEVVDVPACPLFGESLSAAWPDLRGWARERQGVGSEITVQAGRGGVVVAEGPAGFARWRPGGAGWESIPEAGEVDVAEADSSPLFVPAGGFAQVGAAANRALVQEVLAAVGPAPGAVLELYAGAGNFTRHLVRVAASVLAMDGDAAAVARGRRQVPSARWKEQSQLGSEDAGFDTMVVDPPRAGLDESTLARVAQARRRLVYVSCDPQTLGRDAALLVARGMRVVGAVGLDLMPQTFHVEVVTVFEPGSQGGAGTSRQEA